MADIAYFDLKSDHPPLDAEECWCGKHKGKKVSVCCECYELLTPELRLGLHKQLGLGYEEGYQEAVGFLSFASERDKELIQQY